MAVDYAEKEREFIAGLKADTGRDLSEWMNAIRDQGLGERNRIIDWLRQQRFSFARAAWLERIHHNGGRPVYSDAVVNAAEGAARRPSAGSRPSGREHPAPQSTGAAMVDGERGRAVPGTSPMAELATDHTAAVEALLIKGKAYRPLAEFLLREVRRVLPSVQITADKALVSMANPAEFAVLSVAPTGLRLGLHLARRPYDSVVQKAKLAGASTRISHMIVLTDARRIDDGLFDLIRAADISVNR